MDSDRGCVVVLVFNDVIPRRGPNCAHLVHASRAEAGLWASIDRHRHIGGCVREFLLDPEVGRLVALVVDATSCKVGEDIEGDDTVRFRVLDLLELRRRPIVARWWVKVGRRNWLAGWLK